MSEIDFKINDNGRGSFFLEKAGERLAEMTIGISEKNLTVYHTEVSDKLKGEGIGKKLIATMVSYARQHGLKVIPLCNFVRAQFTRHSEQYADVWNRNWH